MNKILLLLVCVFSVNAQMSKFEPLNPARKAWLSIAESHNFAQVYHSQLEASGVALMLNGYLKLEGWKIAHNSKYKYIRDLGDYYTWPKSVGFTKVSQAPHKSSLKVQDSYYFIERGMEKLMLNVGTSSFVVYYNEKNKKSYQLALDFKSGYSDFFNKNSPYKGKALEYNGRLNFLTGVDELSNNWNQFIFPLDAKNKIENTIDGFIGKYNKVDWSRYKLPHSRGVILYGPPGTGKSFVASVLISNVLKQRYKNQVTYIHVQSRNIRSSNSVREVYQVARKYAPAIVFFEDIDLISGTDRSDQAKIKNELMQQLSGLETLKGVLTIGTTNYFERIDYALKRSKRLGFHFEVGLPTFKSRAELFKMFLSKKEYELDMSSMNFTKLAQLTEGMTGADIKEIVDLVVQKSIRTISGRTKIDISQAEVEKVITKKQKSRFGGVK